LVARGGGAAIKVPKDKSQRQTLAMMSKKASQKELNVS